MGTMNRRDFLHDTAALAAMVAAAGVDQVVRATDDKAAPPTGGANDTLRVACIGVHGQGMQHVRSLAGKHNCVITTICDADEAVIGPAMSHVQKAQGKAPKFEQDLRKVMEDKSIDIITTATPNHWHALIAIWAMQNGKDVYVEKPVSHNVSEGRRIVETARKYNKICQTGTQSRSNPGMRETIEFVHSGKIGKVTLARGLCYKSRPTIGKVDGEQAIPKTVNYDLWTGPAPLKPLMRKRLHYDWHWIWDYGCGDLGNQGIHEMDKARWGLNKNEIAKSVISLGGRLGYIDDGETANTQMIVLDYGDSKLVFEVRGLPSDSPYPKGVGSSRRGSNFVGNIWYGTEGVVVSTNYNSGVALDLKGNVIKKFAGDGDHYGNFIKAVRSRKSTDLHADILEGHLSSSLCHLGNISYRLGSQQPINTAGKSLGDDKQAYETFASMSDHLGQNMVKDAQIRVGRKLQIDQTSETFVSDPEANLMLTREYRKGFEVPAKV